MNYAAATKPKLIELIVEQQHQITEKDHQIIEKDHQIIEKDHQIEKLIAENLLLKSKLFGSSSEKQSTAPEDNLLDEAVPPNAEEQAEIEAVEQEIQVSSHTRQKAGQGARKPLPDNLPFIEIVHDVAEEDKFCSCGDKLSHIKDEISMQLEIIPAQMYIVKHIRRKYGGCENKCDTSIKLAPMPLLPLPKSIAAPGLLSHVVVSKYQDHLPLYRQEQILQRLGIDIVRQTLSLWVLKGSELLMPLYELMIKQINAYDVAYADETTLQVINEQGKRAQSKSYMWLVTGGAAQEFSYVFKYSPSRSVDVLFELLGDFEGYLHCDGYSGYDAFYKRQKERGKLVTLVGCWYHMRRKFIEAAKTSKSSGIAKWIIKKVARLAKMEKDFEHLGPEQRHEQRQQQSVSIIQEIRDKLATVKDTIPPKSKLGQAVTYTCNQWDKLDNYTLDGRLENSNNLSERGMKHFVTGRKNWLFAYSVEGAICSAIYFSFSHTCKHHQVNFYLWLKYVFSVIREHPKERLHELLPYNVAPELLEAAGKLPELKYNTS